MYFKIQIYLKMVTFAYFLAFECWPPRPGGGRYESGGGRYEGGGGRYDGGGGRYDGGGYARYGGHQGVVNKNVADLASLLELKVR